MLTNLEFTNLGGMLMYDVFDAYLLDRERAWNRDHWPLWLAVDEPPEITGDKARAKLDMARKAGTSPSLPLAKLAGKYRCDLYGEIEILDVSGGLELNLLNGLGLHAAYDAVFAEGGTAGIFGLGAHYSFRVPGL